MRSAGAVVDSARLGDDVATAPAPALPIVVTPRAPELARDAAAVAAWLAARIDAVEALLAEAGAVLLRGFAIGDTKDFAALVAPYSGPANGYSGGATARAAISGRVFEATRSPPDVHLMLHQEMAYLPRWPRKLAFFCKRPPTTGGETIIADVRAFERRVDPRLRRALEERGIRYTRNFRAPGPFPIELETTHRTWRQAFYTDDPAEAERKLAATGMTGRWLDDGSLSASYVACGFIDHPLTGEKRWFNHLASQTITPQSMAGRWPLYAENYAGGRPRPYEVRFGDGGEIPLEDVVALFPLLDAVTVATPWRAGDVMLIDNVQTFHGRNPFTGERDVQVALLEEGLQ